MVTRLVKHYAIDLVEHYVLIALLLLISLLTTLSLFRRMKRFEASYVTFANIYFRRATRTTASKIYSESDRNGSGIESM